MAPTGLASKSLERPLGGLVSLIVLVAAWSTDCGFLKEEQAVCLETGHCWEAGGPGLEHGHRPGYSGGLRRRKHEIQFQ